MNPRLFESSDKHLLPAGVELMHETPETIRTIGGAASEFSEISLQGSTDADGSETTSSLDPGTLDPFTLSDARIDFRPDSVHLN